MPLYIKEKKGPEQEAQERAWLSSLFERYDKAVKIGPWGAACGTPCDINMCSCPRSLRSIRIWSDDSPGGCIKGLSFTYEDQTALAITINIGGCTSSCKAAHENRNTIGAAWSPKCYRGRLKEIRLPECDRGKLLTHVSGTTNEAGVTSLVFLTNLGTKVGPYGWPSGTQFSLSLPAGEDVGAFFGNAGDNHSLRSLGLYVNIGSFQSTLCVGPWGVSPWGPSSGVTSYRKWNDGWNLPTSSPDQLQSIIVRSSERSGGRVYGFSFTYLDEDGTSICSGQWGSKTRGQNHVVCMNKDNYITFMGGTYDEYGITSLRFISTQDNYGPFGCSIGTPFSMLLQNNAALVSFFGEFNDHIVTSIGAFVVPEANEPDHTESHTIIGAFMVPEPDKPECIVAHTNWTPIWIDRVVNKIIYKYGSWGRKLVTKPDTKM